MRRGADYRRGPTRDAGWRVEFQRRGAATGCHRYGGSTKFVEKRSLPLDHKQTGLYSSGDQLRSLLTLEATKWQYTHGVRNVETISPDTWGHVQPLLDRPGNQEIQLALFYSYGSNPALYPKWQEYLREHQPPTLIVWGKNDAIFPAEGAHPYNRDLKNLEFHLFDTGHFALEEDGQQIASLIRNFLGKQLSHSE